MAVKTSEGKAYSAMVSTAARQMETIREMVASSFDRRRVQSVSGALLYVVPTDPNYNGPPFPVAYGRELVVAPGDDVATIRIGDGEMAISVLRKSTDPEPTYPFASAMIPLHLESLANAGTTNLSTYIELVKTQVYLPVGTWGCAIRASGVMWRSVATGFRDMRIRVGGLAREIRMNATDHGDMTIKGTHVGALDRYATFNPIIATETLLDVAIDYKGASTAATTTIANAELSGFLYRIA